MRRAITLLVSLMLGAIAHAREDVQISQGTHGLKGVLFRPQSVSPAAAIVALHGCGGIADTRGRFRSHYQDWGERLSAAGFVVLFPDSFGSRGLGSQCRVRNRTVRPSPERVNDANAARLWLQSQSFVAPERVFLLGWSNGGSTTLWAVRPSAAPQEGHDFRAAVAFYPGCRRLADTDWSARLPTLILIGGADNWTPARECERLLAHDGVEGAAQAAMVTYYGAYHSFDHPDLPVQQLTGLAFTPDSSGRALIGSNAKARADAFKRVEDWFSR